MDNSYYSLFMLSQSSHYCQPGIPPVSRFTLKRLYVERLWFNTTPAACSEHWVGDTSKIMSKLIGDIHGKSKMVQSNQGQ